MLLGASRGLAVEGADPSGNGPLSGREGSYTGARPDDASVIQGVWRYKETGIEGR